MKFFGAALLTSLFAMASLAAPEPRQTFCAEAARFGVMQVVPSDLVPGSSYTLHTDFECGISKGYMPKYLDYYLEVPAAVNNGHQAPILIARREFVPPSTSNPEASLTFTAQIPLWDGFVHNSSYVITLHNHYIQNTTDNQEIYLVGGTQVGINLTT
ncbi:hypothetical protein QCA50_008665 [Cerrena zonata]|uniref:Uncharacterized protein n=1 Tax=Cerrena zonata TaxID=2478898 RepID=A0AAW0GAC9_9APHY